MARSETSCHPKFGGVGTPHLNLSERRGRDVLVGRWRHTIAHGRALLAWRVGDPSHLYLSGAVHGKDLIGEVADDFLVEEQNPIPTLMLVKGRKNVLEIFKICLYPE
jgi:hypothetical protein